VGHDNAYKLCDRKLKLLRGSESQGSNLKSIHRFTDVSRHWCTWHHLPADRVAVTIAYCHADNIDEAQNDTWEDVMKTALIATVIAGVFAVPSFAADQNTGAMGGQGPGQGQTVAQKKAEILAHIEQRITNSQAEKTCIQSATTHDALHACREKYRPQQRAGGQGGGQQNNGQQQGRREQQM
jgi:hypothetical protein